MEVSPTQSEKSPQTGATTQKDLGKAARGAEYYQDLSEPARRAREKAKTLKRKEERSLGVERTARKIDVFGHFNENQRLQDRLAAHEAQIRALETEPDQAERAAEREELLERNLEQYYTAGAVAYLAQGFLDVLPTHFVVKGFEEIEGESDLDLREQADARVAEYGADQLKELEHAALEAAVGRGAFLYEHAYGGSEVDFALPVENPELPDLLYQYGMTAGALAELADPAEREQQGEALRRLSYKGLHNILKRVADVWPDPDVEPEKAEAMLEAGRAQFEFFVDNFGYREHVEEFEDHFFGLAAVSGRAYNEILMNYLAGPEEESAEVETELPAEAEAAPEPEVAEVEVEQPAEESPEIDSEEMSERQRIATVKEVNIDWLKEFVENWRLTEQNILRWNGEQGGGTEEALKSAIRQRMIPLYSYLKAKRFLEEAETIMQLDKDANCYIEGFKFGDKSKIPTFPYLVIRFGNPQLQENCIYAESTAPAGAFYTWHGKGEKEDWRQIFSQSPTAARANDGVRAHIHGKRELLDDSIERMYSRVHSEVPLPIRQVDGMTEEQAGREAARGWAKIRQRTQRAEEAV